MLIAFGDPRCSTGLSTVMIDIVLAGVNTGIPQCSRKLGFAPGRVNLSGTPLGISPRSIKLCENTYFLHTPLILDVSQTRN